MSTDEADLEQLEQENQQLLTQLKTVEKGVGGSQQIAAWIKYFEDWEQWLSRHQLRADELEGAGLPRFSRRLIAIQKDLYGAKAVFLEMHSNAVKSEEETRRIWDDAARERIRIVDAQIKRNKAVFDESNRQWGALLRNECPHCGHPLGPNFACHCPCQHCHLH